MLHLQKFLQEPRGHQVSEGAKHLWWVESSGQSAILTGCKHCHCLHAGGWSMLVCFSGRWGKPLLCRESPNYISSISLRDLKPLLSKHLLDFHRCCLMASPCSSHTAGCPDRWLLPPCFLQGIPQPFHYSTCTCAVSGRAG